MRSRTRGAWQRGCAMSVIDLFGLFPDEESAAMWIESKGWLNGGRYCPKCGSKATRETKDRKPMPFSCSDCRSYFSVRTGTVMQARKVPVQKWAIALYPMADGSKGLCCYAMAKQLGVTQKTARLLMHKIRQGFLENNESRSWGRWSR